MIMPIYFNISAHFWIAYVLLFNGLAASQSLCLCSTSYRDLVESFEARALSGLFISILINGASLLVLQNLGFDFAFMRFLLPAYSVVLLIWLTWALRANKTAWKSIVPEFGVSRLLLYLFVFLVLFYNGGLIEQIADSWWHLSLANKIGMLNSLDARHHLTGVPMRFYPPLWHGNLAVLHKVSDISLPVLWNAFTAWGGSLKVMAFYLLALGLSRDRAVAVLSALLFVLLPGLGDSYLRVSAWPSHVSYTAWFCMFYVAFAIFDTCGKPGISAGNDRMPVFVNRCWLCVRQNRVAVASLIALSVVVLFSHLAELFWFACGLLFYAVALCCHQLLGGPGSRNAEPAGWLLHAYLFWGLLSIIAATCLTYYPVAPGPVFSDIHLVPVLLLGTAFSFLYLLSDKSPLSSLYTVNGARVLLLFVVAAVLVSVDLRQLLSLFNYELSYRVSGRFEGPVLTTGWLGGQLELPGWHMQLRGGLLYSGILAIIASVFMAVVRPNRGTLFLAANAVIPFLFLVSPYLYQWLSDVLDYTSSWRIALLIFHPIVLAVFVRYLWETVAVPGAGR